MSLSPEDFLAQLRLMTNPFVSKEERNAAAYRVASHLAEGGETPKCPFRLGEGVLKILTLLLGREVEVIPQNGDHPVRIGPIRTKR